MEQFPDEMEGMIWGFRVCLWWSVFAIIFLAGAWIAAVRKFKDYKEFDDENDMDIDTLTIVELKQEMLKRRMHSYSF